MEAPYILISAISPESGKKVDVFDKHSKYITKVIAPTDLAAALFSMLSISLRLHIKSRNLYYMQSIRI